MSDKSILLVEDNSDDVELTIRAFRHRNLDQRILVARDGPEAIDTLLGSPEVPLPSLVLLDLKLPGMDGFDVLRRIRAEARTRFLPVVILTSSDEPIDLVRGYELGANSYVRKPLAFREFLTAAQQIAAYWLQLNEVPV